MEAVVVLVKLLGLEKQQLQSQVVAAHSPYTAAIQHPCWSCFCLMLGPCDTLTPLLGAAARMTGYSVMAV